MSSYSTDEIRALVDFADEDLAASKSLFNVGQYRNSVVLSYYSMYSIARALLLVKGSEPSTHSGLISEFGRLYVVNGDFDKDLASDFARARHSRENASYVSIDTFSTFNRENAKDNIDLAERFIFEAKRLLKNHI